MGRHERTETKNPKKGPTLSDFVWNWEPNCSHARLSRPHYILSFLPLVGVCVRACSVFTQMFMDDGAAHLSGRQKLKLNVFLSAVLRTQSSGFA
jgi:hypothetical protein